MNSDEQVKASDREDELRFCDHLESRMWAHCDPITIPFKEEGEGGERSDC